MNLQLRAAFEANLLPRPHFNADISFYRDRDDSTHVTSNTTFLQLHLYL